MKNIKLLVSVFKAECETVGDWIVPVSAGAALYDKDDRTVELRDDSGITISKKTRITANLPFSTGRGKIWIVMCAD